MKKNFFKYLNPPFLRRLDEYLLVNYPTVWETKTHYVMFISLMMSVIFFLFGFCYPVSLDNLAVAPAKPIRISDESYFIYSCTLLLFFILYWIYAQSQIVNKDLSFKDIFIIYCFYFVCLFYNWSVTSNSFRLGLIYKTAYGLMDERDIDFLESNDFFAYGILFPDEDSLQLEKVDIHLSRWEKSFKKYRVKEDSTLRKRYTKDNHFIQLNQNSLARSIGRNSLSNNELSQYRMYRLRRKGVRKNKRLLLSSKDSILQAKYNEYYYNNRILNSSNFKGNYSLNYEEAITLNGYPIPSYLHKLESGVRSVKHARQYLTHKIFFCEIHVWIILSLLASFILFVVRYFSIVDMVFIVPLMMFCWIFFENINNYFVYGFFFVVTSISFISYQYFLLRDRKSNGFYFFTQLILTVNSFLMVLNILYGINIWENFSGKIELWLFYGVLLTSIFVSFLMPHIETRPNSE